MEAVGARLGRSSTRYGPTAAFTGPVRKWKKKWVHLSPVKNNNNNNPSQNSFNATANGVSNGDTASRLLFYKWTPLSQSQDNNNGDGRDKDSAADTESPESPPRRKFKYVPIAMLEEQNKEPAESDGAENDDGEAKPSDLNQAAEEASPGNDGLDEKPDINDTPMEESQPHEDKKIVQDLNESSLDGEDGVDE